MTAIEDIKIFEASSLWIDKHYQSLRETYPDEYVAVHKQEVVGHHTDISALLEHLKQQYPNDNAHIPVEFISKEDVQYIL